MGSLTEKTTLVSFKAIGILPMDNPGRPQEVSAYIGWHIAAIDKTLAIAARGILPAWRTTPIASLFRDAGLLSAAAALE